MDDIFSKDLSGEMVSPNELGYEALIDDIFRTMETAQELATVSIRDQKRVHELMRKILGKELLESTTVLPPLYIDYGKPVTIGKGCFIQQCCTFFERGGIAIGNDVFIGPKVNLITINHDVNPDNRSATYGCPIVIEDKVWIGINSTDIARCENRLRGHHGCRQRGDERCSGHDHRGRQSGKNH